MRHLSPTIKFHMANFSRLSENCTGNTNVLKEVNEWDISNYRPIPVLPSFLQMLEKIRQKRFYERLNENNFVYKKQFGFQRPRSAKHTTMHLADQINCRFLKNICRLGIFID